MAIIIGLGITFMIPKARNMIEGSASAKPTQRRRTEQFDECGKYNMVNNTKPNRTRLVFSEFHRLAPPAIVQPIVELSPPVR